MSRRAPLVPPKKSFLTIEIAEDIAAFAYSDLKNGVAKLLELLVNQIGQDVLSYDSQRGPEGLLIVKAQHEGAKNLLIKFLTEVDNIRKADVERDRVTT